MFPQIVKTYVETDQIRYVFRNFPLFSIHPWAQKAAEAAECAGAQGQYWEMHDALFESQERWSRSEDAEVTFKELAADLGLDQSRFTACLDEGTYADRVTADFQEGVGEGVTGTPAFRINGTPLSGVQPLSRFSEVIDYYLAGGETPTLKVAADSFRSMGRADAPVVITEFSDFQCPACGQVAREVIPDLIARYVDTGKARYVYREFPLNSIHPAAQKASEAAVCAGQQGYYWEMNEKLFATQGDWGAQGADPISYFGTYASDLELDVEAFSQCLDSGESTPHVQGDLMAGEAAGVKATPTFFVNDLVIRGGLPMEAFGRVIDYVAADGPKPEIVPPEDDWHVRGNKQTARAITVAFVDYASPQSAQHAREVLPQLVETYIDSGDLVYILHPWSGEENSLSAQAARASECSGQQGKFWEMHDKLFAEQETWTQIADPRSSFIGYAQALDLDTAKFETCLDSEWAVLRVQAGNVVAALYGVPGAPVFLFNNGQGQQGSPTFEEFKTTIDSILKQ